MQIYSLFFQTQLARNLHGRCCKSWSNFLGSLHRLWTSSDIAVKGLALIWYCWNSKSLPLTGLILMTSACADQGCKAAGVP